MLRTRKYLHLPKKIPKPRGAWVFYRICKPKQGGIDWLNQGRPPTRAPYDTVSNKYKIENQVSQKPYIKMKKNPTPPYRNSALACLGVPQKTRNHYFIILTLPQPKLPISSMTFVLALIALTINGTGHSALHIPIWPLSASENLSDARSNSPKKPQNPCDNCY